LTLVSNACKGAKISRKGAESQSRRKENSLRILSAFASLRDAFFFHGRSG